MYCKQCGAKVEDNAQFCENCGAALKHVMPENSGLGTTETTSIQANEYEPNETSTDKNVQNASSKKSKIILVISVAVALVALVVGGIFVAKANREVTIETLLEMETVSDVRRKFGEPSYVDNDFGYGDCSVYERYDDVAYFMGEVWDSSFVYENEVVTSIDLRYTYEGGRDLEKFMEIMNYRPTVNELEKEDELRSSVVNSFTDMFGRPEIYKGIDPYSPTYCWELENWRICVFDRNGADMSDGGDATPIQITLRKS